MRPSHIAIIIALVVAVFAAMSSVFTVHQAKQALVLQLGNVKRLVNRQHEKSGVQICTSETAGLALRPFANLRKIPAQPPDGRGRVSWSSGR